jgi:WD40 repeat protein/predicted Ser/Thr protein kinase
VPLILGSILKDRFRVESQLGKGGMGAVYLAHDQLLDINVAIKENLSPSSESERQFLREARILAGLRHPNLPRVSDYFSIEDRQYLVMDYIEGQDLHDLVKNQQPTVEEILRWADTVCEALIYLHTREPAVIHRDIKPSNIKLQPDGTVMLVDFGIAKEFDLGTTTTTGARGLTPGFSPPEQYGLRRTDARSDQYSLAATLYDLLAGQRPTDSFERLFRKKPITPVRELNDTVPAGLEIAIHRAMELEPDDRFPDIESFRDALHEQVADETIREEVLPQILKPESPDPGLKILMERAQALEGEGKWEEALETWRQYLELGPEDPEFAQAEIKRVEDNIKQVHASDETQVEMAEAVPEPTKLPEEELVREDIEPQEFTRIFARVAERVRREGWSWQRILLWGGMGVAIAVALIVLLARSPIPNSIIVALTRPTTTTTFTPEPTKVSTITILPTSVDTSTPSSSPMPSSTSTPDLTATAQAQATNLALATPSVTSEPTEAASLLLSVERASYPVSVAWSPDGSRLATARHQNVSVWHPTSGQRLRQMSGNMDQMNSVAWSPNGLKLASTSYQVVWIWDYSSGSMINVLWGHGDYDVNSVAWSPDGLLLASGADCCNVIIWDASSGKQLYALSHHGAINSVAWSPDSTQLASGGTNNRIMVWDATSGEQLYNLEHGSDVNSVAWSPDGTQLASGCTDGSVHIWDTSSWEQLDVLYHGSDVTSIAWSPDGTKLASGGQNNRVLVWDTTSGKYMHALRGYEGAVNSVAWSPDGTRLASASHEEEGGLRVWNIP